MSTTATTATTGQETAPVTAPSQATGAPDGERKPSGMTDADHALLKEAMQYKAENKRLKAAQEKADNEKLTKDGEFKALADKHAQRATALERSLINAELRAVAAQSGIVDLDIVRLIDQSTLAIGDDGAIAGAAEAIAALKAAKPWAFAAGSAPVVPKTAGPGSPVQGGFKTYDEWKAAPFAERSAWAQKHPDAYKALADRAMAPKPR